MSTSYYIVNRKKKTEYENFEIFWNAKLIPEFKTALEKYCKNVDGELINEDFVEYLFDDQLWRMKYAPILEGKFQERIGCAGVNGFRFDNWLNINCLKELQNYLEDNSDCIVEDDEGNDVTGQLEELIGYPAL